MLVSIPETLLVAVSIVDKRVDKPSTCPIVVFG